MASGCVLSDPPEYGTVKQTPPFLQLAKSVPTPFQLNPATTNELSTVSVSVRSEDAGKPLRAVLFRNYDPQSQQIDELASRDIAPSVLEDDTRTASLRWLPLSDERCVQLTVLVTHTENLTKDNEPIDAEDVAYATWWFLVTKPGSSGDTILAKNCGPTGEVN
jgi:hypothetical protein